MRMGEPQNRTQRKGSPTVIEGLENVVCSFNGLLITQKKGKVQHLQFENLKLVDEGCTASKVYVNI